MQKEREKKLQSVEECKISRYFCLKDTTMALTMSPGRYDWYISTLSISVARTSCCLPRKKRQRHTKLFSDMLSEMNKNMNHQMHFGN
jgi:hypothetical protein